MRSVFRCPECGKTDTYVMQDDVRIITSKDGRKIWKLYCHFCGADMDGVEKET